MRAVALLPSLALAAGLAMGCAEELVVPTAAQVDSLYTIQQAHELEMSGNVVELTVFQSSDQLRRGGTLWARVGPYIFLFSEPTRLAFQRYSGLAAVRVITRDPSGNEVARATLASHELNQITWPRALNVAGLARRDGTQRVSLLEDLIRFGEEHTEFEYSSRYVR